MMADWADINEYVLLSVLSHLQCGDISRCALVCRRWLLVTRSDLLWRLKVRERLPSWPASCPLSPGTSTWREEHRRLVEQVPRHPTSLSTLHHHGAVTDLAFSSSGEMMATCGEDARLVVWRQGEVVLEKDLHKCVIRSSRRNDNYYAGPWAGCAPAGFSSTRGGVW